MKRIVALALAAVSTAAVAADDLAGGFADPPAAARPRTWWHWLNGNITVAGLDADLEWMKSVGLGGVQAFDASLGTPQVVAHPIPYMTPEWKAAFDHAAATADRLGLELAISSSPGWSETGGPWVKPEDAMKKLVWASIDVDGGKPVSARLPSLPSATGPYGSAPFADPLAATGGGAATPLATASGAVAVFAYPSEEATPLATPAATAGTGASLDAARLADDREDTTVSLPQVAETAPAIMLAYPAPRTIRSATLFLPGAIAPFGGAVYAPVLEAETDGRWHRIAELPLANVPTTVAFVPVAARRFRVRLEPSKGPPPALARPAPGAIVVDIFPKAPPDTPISVATFRLGDEERVDRFEAKAGFATVPDYYALSTATPGATGPAPARVINLSERLRPDGMLDWTPPAGRWRIVRMGWSLIGTTNHPATPASTGLEVDKYDAAAVRRYIDTYLGMYHAAIASGDVKALLTDSIESGDANWTPDMFAQFRRLRGYDPRPWLPVLTGAVIGSRARSDAFLYDWRRTLADLLASQHYGTITDVAHDRGLKVYGEALEDRRPQLGDDMQMRAYADVPMAALWAFGAGEAPRPTLIGDMLGAASVAHLTGRNFAAAESFTAAFAPWAFAPADLKRVADYEFAMGINRPVIHTSPSSPMDDKLPGLSLAIFGQYFNRHESWAGMARAWIDYLARTSYLMQAGRHVADVAYFFGEEAPLTALYADHPLADTPSTRGFDFVDAHFLETLHVQDGMIVSRGGARYRVLYLGGTSSRMTLPTLRRIAALADAGATIVGPAPIADPSLADDSNAFAALVARLWPGSPSARAGKGRVFAGRDVEPAFASMGLAPDLGGGEGLIFQHRTAPEAEIYLVHNRGQRPFAGELRFRVTGHAPEQWIAETGEHRPLSWHADGDATVVSVPLAVEGTALIVFKPTTARGGTVQTSEHVVATAAARWHITFQPGRGAPTAVTLASLGGLERQADPGVRYFSGVATYAGEIAAPVTKSGFRVWLDLGRVGDVAEVSVNGKPVGIVWHAPYRLDVTGAIRPGSNAIEVHVADTWVNRLIGDAQPNAKKITFVAAPTYKPDAPLRPAGLIGPVTLVSQTEKRQ